VMKTALDDRVRCPRLWCRANICWYARLPPSRTFKGATFSLRFSRADKSMRKKRRRGPYRNPVIFAKELQAEMLRCKLTRKELAARHGVSSDRITQWLCLLKLPDGTLKEVEALGDNWDRKVITERQLRKHKPLDPEARKQLLLKHQIRYIKPRE